MKLKVTIPAKRAVMWYIGPYLAELAVRLALRGFDMHNEQEDSRQAVIALVEGDKK